MGHPHIVKRKEHEEPYDNHKVYASCYAACLNASLSRKEAETICAEVMADLDRWIEGKDMVRSKEIFKEITQSIHRRNKEAAFMYKTHLDIS